MLFLEERFKEKAYHVTAMGNTTCIFHKNRGNQCYDSLCSLIPPVLDKEAVRVRADCNCVSWTVTSLLFPLWFDLPRKSRHITRTTTSLCSLACKMAFFPTSLLKTGHKPTLKLHHMQTALLHSSPCQPRDRSGQAWLQLWGSSRAMRRCRKWLCQAI